MLISLWIKWQQVTKCHTFQAHGGALGAALGGRRSQAPWTLMLCTAGCGAPAVSDEITGEKGQGWQNGTPGSLASQEGALEKHTLTRFGRVSPGEPTGREQGAGVLNHHGNPDPAPPLPGPGLPASQGPGEGSFPATGQNPRQQSPSSQPPHPAPAHPLSP